MEKGKEKRSLRVDTTCSTGGAAVVVTSRQQAEGRGSYQKSACLSQPNPRLWFRADLHLTGMGCCTG